ncbi:MAG TPA: DUF5654 family protein [Candidatus Paceibacterota bacterium]
MSLDRIKEESKKTTQEMKARIGGFVAGGFGIAAGIAWNDAIRALIEYLFPLDKNSILMKFTYAFILTLVIVFITVYLMRFLSDSER